MASLKRKMRDLVGGFSRREHLSTPTLESVSWERVIEGYVYKLDTANAHADWREARDDYWLNSVVGRTHVRLLGERIIDGVEVSVVQLMNGTIYAVAKSKHLR